MSKEAPTRLVKMAAWFYLPMAASLFWVRPPGGLRVADWESTALALVAAALAGVVVIALSRRMETTGWGRAITRQLGAMVAGLTPRQALALALLSALGEEFLFRGVLLGAVGFWGSSLLFGAAHFPMRRLYLPWTLFAFVMGMGLAGLTLWSQNLWPAVWLHYQINYFNLLRLGQLAPAGTGTEQNGVE